MVGAGVPAVKVRPTPYALKRAILVHTDGRVTLAAIVGPLHTQHTLAGDALAGTRRITVPTVQAGDTLATVGTRTAERCIPATSGVIDLIAGRTIAVDALAKARCLALRVLGAAHTGGSGRAIYTKWGVATATGVIGHIADHALLTDALLTVAVTIDSTLNAP